MTKKLIPPELKNLDSETLIVNSWWKDYIVTIGLTEFFYRNLREEPIDYNPVVVWMEPGTKREKVYFVNKERIENVVATINKETNSLFELLNERSDIFE